MAVDEGHVLNIDAASAGIASIDLSFQLEYSISNKSKSLGMNYDFDLLNYDFQCAIQHF